MSKCWIMFTTMHKEITNFEKFQEEYSENGNSATWNLLIMSLVLPLYQSDKLK